MVLKPVNNGINYQPQLVSRISEPSTVSWYSHGIHIGIYIFFKACHDLLVISSLVCMSDIISGPPVLWVAASGIKGPVQDGPDSPLWLLGKIPMFRYGGKTPEKIVMFFLFEESHG